MARDLINELEQLKRDYLEAEKVSYSEKACLLKLANTFGMVVAMHPVFEEELRNLKGLLNGKKRLPQDQIEEEIVRFRSKIFAEETRRGFHGQGSEKINALQERLLEACRVVKRIMMPILDDFYPVNDTLKASADSVRIKCKKEADQVDLDEPATAFLSFVERLKGKISEDFRGINNTFFMLLDNVKGLERTMSNEFGSDVHLKDFEQFEMKVKDEVGSIVNSFNIHTTIDEIKSAVIKKITNIKRLMEKRKKTERMRAQKARENINNLKMRVVEVEKDAREMSERAKHFQRAATRDGLTGLFNRKAFDMRLKEALADLNEGEELFSLVLFDVDGFKWINDTFGHVAGDKILKKVAQCLKETFRKNDFIARYGGDEFVVVIEGLTEKMAHERILKFQENFRKKRFISQKDGDIKVNISAGVTMASTGESPDDFINRADMAMYESKKQKNS